MNFSYRGTRTRALTAPKIGTEPEGICKFGPRLRSMMEAWLTKKVENCAKEMERATVEAHTGRILMKNLSSSTWVTVQSLQRFVLSHSGSVITAALSRNLNLTL